MNGEDNAEVLKDECDSVIDDIRAAKSVESCPAHEPMSRGVVTLLRCERARLVREGVEHDTRRSQRVAIVGALQRQSVRMAFGIVAILILYAAGKADMIDRLFKALGI